MNVSMNGKPIAAIYFSAGVGGYSGNPERIRTIGDQQLSLSATYHGDHDEFWVVRSVNGKETDRYRCSHVDHIEWAPDTDTAVNTTIAATGRQLKKPE